MLRNGRCTELLHEMTSKEKCCSSHGVTTAWSSEELDSGTLFFWKVLGGGVPCVPCKGSKRPKTLSIQQADGDRWMFQIPVPVLSVKRTRCVSSETVVRDACVRRDAELAKLFRKDRCAEQMAEATKISAGWEKERADEDPQLSPSTITAFAKVRIKPHLCGQRKILTHTYMFWW